MAPRSTALALGLASRTPGHSAALVGTQGGTRGGEPRGQAAWRRPAETGGDSEEWCKEWGDQPRIKNVVV